MKTISIIYPVDINEETFSVRLTADCEIDNDGIGAYEYWGAKCNDVGEDFVDVKNIRWDHDLYTLQENECIRRATDNCEVYDKFEDAYKDFLNDL